MKKTLLLFVYLAFSIGLMYAQTRITGTVTEQDGVTPIPFVTVSVKGAAVTTTTDANGNYAINVPAEGKVLVFAFVGMTSEEVNIGGRTVINVSMEPDALTLDAALITAEFGIKRVARSVGSSVQNVKASDIIESGRESFVNALQGRVAGMTVTSTSGVPGASTTVVLRSITSISGNNQPLYVVDGVPINNSTFDGATGFAKDEIADSRVLDASSRGNDINPDDIESMTILKGAAAAALYGSDASNGAIIITTKKGSSGKGKVSYSNSFTVSKSYGYPEIQTKYANGSYGTTNFYNQSRFGGLYPDDVVLYDNISSLIQTGFSQRHNISIEGGTDKLTLRGSGSLLEQKGVVKTTDYSRKNFSLSGRAEVSKWLNFDASMGYVATTNNKATRGLRGPLYRAVRWPLIDDMSNYITDAGTMSIPNGYLDTDLMNPLFALYKNVNYDTSARTMANVGMNITPTKNTFVIVKYGIDTGTGTNEYHIHPYYENPTNASYGKGSYNIANTLFRDQHINIIAGYNNSWGKFNVGAQVGFNQQENKYSSLSSYGANFKDVNFYSLANCEPSTIVSRTRNTKRRLQGIFGHVEVGYNNMAFLTVRGRNDWSSTLPVDNRSFFYPAVEGSFIVTELKPLKGITEAVSYFKLRGAIAQVGKDADPLSISPALQATEDIGGGYRYGWYGPNPNLKPEMTTSYEIGFEGRFLNDRINADFGYFWTKCDDQYITGFRLSYATGFVLNNMNVGSFTTNGLEFHIDGDIVKKSRFRWNLGLNLTRSTSKVTELPDNVSEYYNAYTWLDPGNLRNGISVGNPITTISGKAYQRNDNGDILIDPGTGIPLIEDTWSVLGDRQPDLEYGITTSVSIGNFRLSALANGLIGAGVVNATKRDLMSTGSSWESVTLREGAPVVFKGVLKNGLENSDNPTVNTISVTYANYGSTIYTGGDEDWFEKGVNYFRLSEIRLTYNVPRKWLEKLVKSMTANVWVSANDLFTLTNYSGIDAVGNASSAALGGSGGVGFDYWGVPNPRSFSFGISLTF